MSLIKPKYLEADGIKIFYRSAGAPSSPTLLLLGGFPTTSLYFQNLMQILSPHYHVLAPDYPGFGFTEVPFTRNYQYTFANLSTSMIAFMDALSIKQYSMYIFDYGTPIGLRMAIQFPESVTSLIVQNGNAYADGFGLGFWSPVLTYWQTGSDSQRQILRENLFSLDLIKSFYTTGEFPLIAKGSVIPPENYHLDHLLLNRSNESVELHLDLFYDYRTNVDIYPKFQAYLRKSRVPILVVWGKNDICFPTVGAEAYKRDAIEPELHLLEGGHFLLTLHAEEVAEKVIDFLGRRI
ncbi:hypothetical protein MMC09_003671 [Bachmanniomyces sp. S44760]|nr:hypothetical protein [Bachmanniomyces sp. S44760]